MEGVNTILNNSISCQLDAGRAPFQLWEELQGLLLSIEKVLEPCTNLDIFEGCHQMEELEFPLLNALLGKNSVVKKSEQEDTAQQKRLIPGQIGKREQKVDNSLYPWMEKGEGKAAESLANLCMVKERSGLEPAHTQCFQLTETASARGAASLTRVMGRNFPSFEPCQDLSAFFSQEREQQGRQPREDSDIQSYPPQKRGQGKANILEGSLTDNPSTEGRKQDEGNAADLFQQLKEIKTDKVTRILLDKLINNSTVMAVTPPFLSRVKYQTPDSPRISGSRIYPDGVSSPQTESEARIKEQFGRKIEGAGVSEEALDTWCNVDMPAEEKGKAGKIPGEFVGDDAVTAGILSALSRDKYQTPDGPGISESRIYPDGVSSPQTESEARIQEQFGIKVDGQLGLLTEKWFGANEKSLTALKELPIEAEMPMIKPCDSQSVVTRLSEHLPSTPLISNTFNIQVSSSTRSDEDMQLLEKRINKILIEQAERWGIKL
ncbi:MAG: hypothetical protein ABH870_06315 [bacterium]